MSDVAEASGKTAWKKLSGLALGVFAVFGFIESVTAITQAVQTDSAQLTAKVYPSRLKFPHYFDAVLGSGYKENGRTFFNALKKTCPDDQNAKQATPQPEHGTETSKEHVCKHASDLVFASDRISELYESEGVAFDIDLENKGKTKASGIKISSSKLLFLDAYSGGLRVKLDYNSDTGLYSLPDLNPGQKLYVSAWQKGIAYDYGDLYDFQLPQVSFDGPPVEVTKYTYVRSSIFALVDFFDTFGAVFGTILFLVFCGLIGLFAILIIAVIEALITGKSLTALFKAQNSEEPSSDAEAG